MSLVSIIIPAYNASKYISETIQSVLNQTYSNWELVIVNDGSEDNTLDIIDQFSKNDSRIKYFTKNNSGVSETRNIGISNTKGDYIAFLDADDYWLADNLQKKIDLIQSENVDFVYSDMYNCDEILNIKEIAISGTDQNILENILLWNGEVIPGPCSNILLKRRCILDSSIRFHSKLSNLADQHFCVLLAQKYKGRHIKQPLWKYRILKGSMSRSIQILEKDSISAYEIYSELNVFKSFWFKQKCFSNMYYMLAGSWWKDGKNKSRGMYFILRAIINYPPIILNIIK